MAELNSFFVKCLSEENKKINSLHDMANKLARALNLISSALNSNKVSHEVCIRFYIKGQCVRRCNYF